MKYPNRLVKGFFLVVPPACSCVIDWDTPLSPLISAVFDLQQALAVYGRTHCIAIIQGSSGHFHQVGKYYISGKSTSRVVEPAFATLIIIFLASL